jgi:hypothetical protein
MEAANRFSMAVEKVMSKDEVHWVFAILELYADSWRG